MLFYLLAVMPPLKRSWKKESMHEAGSLGYCEATAVCLSPHVIHVYTGIKHLYVSKNSTKETKALRFTSPIFWILKPFKSH